MSPSGPRYHYEFGRRWLPQVPRAAIRHRLGNVHAGLPDAEVEALIRTLIRDSSGHYPPALIRHSVAYALECHHRNRDLYRKVLTGGI